MSTAEAWPSLPLEEWKDTCATLHMWTQVVGKIRLAQSPMVNHWWQVPLYVTPRGLTTSSIPYGRRAFSIDFDFLDHELRMESSDGGSRRMALQPRSVADFHHELMASLRSLDVEVKISTLPTEVEDAIPFEDDDQHDSYDPEYVERFHRVLVQSDRVLNEFRGRFIGKCSPVHFFWGSFDLAVTRFSGRGAPPHPGGVPHLADWVVREAYSHEVSSCGWWPGGGAVAEPMYYCYMYPEPRGYGETRVRPEGASYNRDLGEFVLPYEAVRSAPQPEEPLLAFLQSTYDAGASLAAWDRPALERAPDFPRNR